MQEFNLVSDIGFLGGKVANIFDKVAIWDHFQNLCAKVGVECKEHHARAQAATQTRDWVVAYSEWTSCKDIIVRSEGLLARDDWLWFLGCHALVSANLWAFYSMNFALALTAVIAAYKARVELENVPEALDFKSYVLPTLWKVIYLWASTSDCEEEVLDPDVKAFLIDALGHSRDSVSDFEVRTLKEQCKEFVINKYESVIWDIQNHYFFYSNTEECVRWAREGNKLYKKRYSGKLDYVSKFNEAFILSKSTFVEEASKVLEEIRDDLDLKPWKVKVRDGHPAALYCSPLYADSIYQFLERCYEQLTPQPSEGKFEERKKMIELAKKVRDEQKSLQQMELKGVFSAAVIEKCRAEAWEHAANNNLEEAKACYQKDLRRYRGPSFLHDFAAFDYLALLYTYFRTKYRQSYESGSPDESHFSNAMSWVTKWQELSAYSLNPYPHWQPSLMQLVKLYHEKDRQFMFMKQYPNIRLLVDVNESEPILQYGKKIMECSVKALIQREKHSDFWINVEDSYKDLYYMLQFHNLALWIAIRLCSLDRSTCNITFQGRLDQFWNQSLMPEGASPESAVSQEIWKQSLVWAERRRARIIHFQLAPEMLSTSALEQLGEFDLKDDVAWNILKSSRAACGPGTFVLEYFFSEKNEFQFVYVMTKEDKVFMQILKDKFGFPSIVRITLEWLRNFFSQGSQEKREFMNHCLEWMYQLLISPVAFHLRDMKQEDKLIIVAPEILSDVPFAALRKPNSPVGEGYLIQSHTISVTPSLRMLQYCNQRFKELDQDVPLDTKPGTIVAVGDPAYKERPRRHEKAIGDQGMSPMRLEASGEEVNFIEELFGREHVKKLVGPEATPSEVLKWAKYPSENRVKQVVFHIAAHGIGQDGRKVKKGAIVLAPPASCQQNYDTAGQGAMRRVKDDENFDYDNAQDETELGDFLFSMVDVKEEAQISSHGEVGGIRSRIVVPISKHAPDILKSENISGCGFQWKAHVVVLSACDTARGQIMGEGVLNLPRALTIAGVPCVVVSQWKVRDSSTCKLMKGFYGELRSGKDVSSSLRAAMLKIMKDRGKVHEWAPFVVCGLPTICLPTELQAGTSSCKGHDCGTSSDTKAELRFKDVKVEPLDLDRHPVKRFFELAPVKSVESVKLDADFLRFVELEKAV